MTSNSITECVNKFNTFNQNRDFGDDWTRFLNKISAQNINVANQFEELSKQGASARASVEGVYSAILNGNTRGFGNVKSLISLYNEIGKVNPQNQTAFASAVSQTNVQLGTYLMSIRDGTASMKGYALQLVSTTAKTLALRVASIALNTVLMSAIPVAIGYIINKHKEEQQAIKDTGEEAEAQTNKIQSLYQSYTDIKTAVDNGTESKESLTSATNDLLEALGYEGNAVDDLIKKYGSLENAIDNVVISKLQEAHADLVASVAVYEDELLKIGDNWSASKWGNANTFSFLGDDKEYQKIKDVLNRAEGLTSSVSYGHQGRSNRYSYSLSGDNSTIEGIKQNYETLLALQEDFINEFGAEEAGKLDIYKDINLRLKEIKTAYENYTSEVEALNQNAAKTQVLQSLIGKELPQTIDEYKTYRQELIKSAQSSGAFIGSQEDIANSIDNTLSQMSEFEKFQNRLNNLETAKSLFVEGRFNSKPINDYIESLSDEELEILVELDTDIFDQGIDYVQKTIDEMNGISIHGSFEFTDYQEQLETVYGNIGKLQDALTKLDENKFDFSGDIQDLIKAFPEYSTEILNASGDTEQLRKVLQELLNSQPNDLIDSLTELKGSLASDEDIKAVDNLINILRNSASVAYSVTSLSDSLQDLNDKESILSTVWKEMNEDGHISVSTYKSLCEMGDDYADTVINTNGVLTTTVDEIKKVIQKNYDLEIATKRAEMAQLQYNAAVAGASGDDTSAYVKRITQLDNEIRAKEMQYQMFKSYDYTSESMSSSSSDDEPESVKNFEAELAKRQHEINLGLRKEDASYYDWLLSAAHKAYDGLADYEDELWKYEEQVYEWRKDHEQDLFDQKIENLDKEKEKALENNDFDTAKTSVNTQITETQNRIIELKASGKQDVDDEIKELEEDLDDLNDTLNDINSQEYEFNISIKEDSIEDLEKEFEKSGDTSIYDKQIEIYTGLIADTQDEINRLLDLGYSKESDEIQELVDQIEGYSDDIADIWGKQTDVIKDNVDEQIEALDRSIENTGDTKLYSEKIKVYKDGQQQILDMIKFYRKQGYAEDSAIIKELKKQWNDYQDSISDALQEQANAQVEAYNELLDEQIELLEQQKEAQDEYYDSEIKALEDKKKALEEVNEAIEEQNELEEKRQSLAEAERNLYKNVRLVYTNGQWVQKAREEDLQAVKDAEKDLSDTLRKQEIEALENQITALNDAKSAFDETIDKQINVLKESESNFEKAMEKSYKVRQQLDYEFISSIVGDDKAKEYQTNADNALKAIAESEQSDNNSSDNTNTQTDNSALVNSNNTVAETNQEVADSNVQLAESNSKLDDIQGKGAERNVNTTDTQENTDTTSPLEIDSETRVVFNTLLKKANAFLKNIPIEEFNKLLNNNLKSALDTAPKIADDVDKSKMVMNVVNNVTNAPVITTTVTVNGNGKSDEELANIIATTTESKVTQALGAFVQGATNRFTKMMYGNT